MNSRTKLFLIFSIPAAVFAVLSLGLFAALRSEMRENNTLLAMVHVEDESADASSEESFYEPVPVDHNYELSGNKILLHDSTFGEIWIPVLEGVELSTHPLEFLQQQENGRMAAFDEHGNQVAMTGIDISAHNTVTDWNAVKADGIEFVMLRCAYRTYGGGELRADAKFREHYQGAKAAGLKVGAYVFSQAISEQEAIEEAQMAAKQLEGCEIDFPVVYDWEIIYDDPEGARTDHVSVETLTACTLAFCQNIEAFGYQPMIYQNKRTSLFKLDLPRLQDYPFWLAEYNDGPTYPYDYDMWQYSCKGTVAGIQGDVDLNLSFYDYSKD